MDGLSGTAGIFGVVSLAMQLTDGIKKPGKFCIFLSRMREYAPEVMRSMVHELNTNSVYPLWRAQSRCTTINQHNTSVGKYYRLHGRK